MICDKTRIPELKEFLKSPLFETYSQENISVRANQLAKGGNIN